MICPCMKVSKEDIAQAIEDGASNFKDIKKKTKIVTKCGKCKNRAQCFIRELFAEKDMIEERDEGVCLGCQGDFFEPKDQEIPSSDEKTQLSPEVKSEKKKKKNKEKKKDKEKKEKKAKKKLKKKESEKQEEGCKKCREQKEDSKKIKKKQKKDSEKKKNSKD